VPAIRAIERLLLVIGLVCLGAVAYAYFAARFTAVEENRRLDEAVRARQRRAEATDSFASFAPRATNPAAPKLEEGALVGRLDIPRIGISSIVLEGVEPATLRRGVGHIPGTGLPFQQGNVGIAGHRDSFFRALKDVDKDDLIELTTPAATYRYRVEWTRIVEPEETAVLADPGAPALTLVTCYPFYYIGSAPERFVVRAVRVGDDASAISAFP